METEATDIDEVLKESEELLDRLKLNDLYDGGASLASLGSVVSIRDTISTTVVTDSPYFVETPKRKIDPPIQSENGTISVQRVVPSYATMESSPVDLAPLLPTPPPVSKWEKVSSAAAGDDDFVPIVDYTKEKRSAALPSTRNMKTKVSRLEAYREKARKRRQRRMIILLIISTVVAIVWWGWSRSGSILRNKGLINRDAHDKGNTSDITISDPIEGADAVSKPEIVDVCPWDMAAKFASFLEEIRCIQGEAEILPSKDDVKEEANLHGTMPTIMNDTQSAGTPKCKNIFARLFSKKCRQLGREKKKNSINAE